MINKDLAQLLYKLNIYKASFDNKEVISEGDTTIIDSNGTKRKIINDDISQEELGLLIQAKQANDIKSIKGMVTFITCIVAIGVALSVISFFGLMY